MTAMFIPTFGGWFSVLRSFLFLHLWLKFFHDFLRLIDEGSNLGYVHEEKSISPDFMHILLIDLSFIVMNQIGLVWHQT